MEYFIDVIVPVPLSAVYTYQVTDKEYESLHVGMRVVVPFGKRTVYTAIVYAKHLNAPKLYQAKNILTIIDETVVVTQNQLAFWQWIATYYMCNLGDVYKASLPSAMLPESETVFNFVAHKTVDLSTLTDDEFLLYEAFEQQPILKLDEVQQILNKKSVFNVIENLLNKGILTLNQNIVDKYKPKYVKYVKLHNKFDDEIQLSNLLNSQLKSDKQRALLLKYFQLKVHHQQIELPLLLNEAGVSKSIYQTLEKKDVFETYELVKDRVSFNNQLDNEITLTELQETTLSKINEQFGLFDVVLLHAVTGSGKTELYIKLIEDVIAQGKQVLYLVPEIALITQLVYRLTTYFGNKVSVYNSKYSDNERVEVYKNVLNSSDAAQIIIGSRSSVFLPFYNLGLIVIDEEHEQSYKQHDPAPRFHARDSAIVLANIFKAKVLLGTATPSLESYYNVYQEKYGYASLQQRFNNTLLPDIVLVDMKEAYKRKEVTNNFSIKLIDAITETLSNGEQVLLFQNRRGFAPVLECITCGNVPHCTMCDVSLTYHKRQHNLKCHYCGYIVAMPTKCYACNHTDLSTKGLGTEQVEEALIKLFPTKKIARMDQDTTKGKYAFEKLIDAFQNREIDILVGTQMIAKGLDFDNVSLVGVMNADNLLSFPDFRSFERAFQLLTQVAGRSGRSLKQGKVIIQTYNPLHNTIQQVTRNDFKGMFKEQMYERLNFKYPPFYRLVHLQLKHVSFEKVRDAANWLATNVKQNINDVIVLGPTEPTINRIRNQYLQEILIKIPINKSSNAIKKQIQKSLNSLETIGAYKAVRVVVNVDYY